MPKFKLGHYQIVTRRLAEFSAQKDARFALKGGSQGPPFFIRGAYWPVTGPRGARRPALRELHRARAIRRGLSPCKGGQQGGKARVQPV